ncbi:MAG: hypothetical protein U0271_13110 [Polyangiaceae bacterium]
MNAKSQDRTHAIVMEAAESKAPWAKLFRLESLRYQQSGWWIDWLLPHEPRLFLAFSLIVPAALWGLGFGLAPDRSAYLTAPDVTSQPLFLPFHFFAVRAVATLFKRGLDSSLIGIGISEELRRSTAKKLFGWLPNVFSIVCAAYWIQRDARVALVAGPNGLTAFDDPDQWALAGLGHPLQRALLAIWILEWIIFGFVLWVQIWSMAGLALAIRKTDFKPHLHRILVHDEYRDFFALISRNATICSIFAIANLAFVAYTGELLPKPTRKVTNPFEFMEEMSDLTSVFILFFIIVAGFVAYISLIRKALTGAVNDAFAAAGDETLEESATPLEVTGSPSADELKCVISRLNASQALLRAIVFQREVDSLGSRGLNALLMKALPAFGTVTLRVYRLITQEPTPEVEEKPATAEIAAAEGDASEQAPAQDGATSAPSVAASLESSASASASVSVATASASGPRPQPSARWTARPTTSARRIARPPFWEPYNPPRGSRQ